ncbi:hypothetical protein [Methylobacterium trifolii]|uniref:hypothetical protein n=1 Tax=Methylobacterium trifolii TaxID=1003092 RepID=UPI001EDCB589|nr:hypothetical protein [Methylobacterium trifolii]
MQVVLHEREEGRFGHLRELSDRIAIRTRFVEGRGGHVEGVGDVGEEVARSHGRVPIGHVIAHFENSTMC